MGIVPGWKTYRLYIRLDRHTVSLSGVDVPEGKIVSENKDYIAVKFPGHKYWVSRGQQGYAPSETVVYKKQSDRTDGLLRSVLADALIGICHARKKAKS